MCFSRSGLDAASIVERMWVASVMQRKMLFKLGNRWYMALSSNPCLCYVPRSQLSRGLHHSL